MPKQLSDIELDEVSVCAEPANEDAVVVIVKAKSNNHDTELPMPPIDDERVEDAADELEAGAEDFDDETLEAVAGEMAELDEAGELVPAFAAMLAGLEEAGETITKMAAAYEDIEGEHEELKKSASLLVSKVEKMAKGGDQEATDLVSILKSSMGGAELDPAVERRVAALEIVAKAAEEKEAVEKARAIGAGKPEELAPVLVRLRKANAKDADYIEGLLKTQAAAIRKSNAFKTLGASDPAPSSAIAKASLAAEEIRKAAPSLSKQQALARVFEENPDLYAEHLAEKHAA